MQYSASFAARRLSDQLRNFCRHAVQWTREPRHTAIRSGRRPSQNALLSGIRSHDFASLSDGRLGDELARAAGSSGLGNTDMDRRLSAVFALVDEAISRRLGTWRLFDPGFDKGSLTVYQELASRVLESGPYKSRVGYYTDESFLESPDFRRSFDPLLAETGLDNDGRTMVDTMVYVAEKSKTTPPWDILLPAGFYEAVSSKDTQRVLSFQATDEQLLAGYLLHEGGIVEMNAGEGKTIAAVFPAVLHAMLGRSVHVITANDYLASRDAAWLRPVYGSLGIRVDEVLSYMSATERKDAYTAGIVYGTLREFGFDFLRDNLKYSRDELVQRPLDIAIVDEADQALIDEARTPLIIAGGPSGSRRSVHKARNAVQRLTAAQGEIASDLEARARRQDLSSSERYLLLAKLYLAQPENSLLVQQFATDPRLRRRVQTLVAGSTTEDIDKTLVSDLYYTINLRHELVTPTEKGQNFLERHLGPIFDTRALEHDLKLTESDDNQTSLAERRRAAETLRRRLSRQHNRMNQVHQMLVAYLLLKRDVDYIVTDDKIVLVDSLTGRSRLDSRYQHGLQNALEAKEGVNVIPESEVLAQISIQGFMKQYSSIAGMTGTALSARDEFRRAYGLDVVAVPPTRPSGRTDFPTRLYPSSEDKLMAVLDEIKFCRQIGRPVLVGTLTVEQSEEISAVLTQHCMGHRLLNAVHNEEEAQVVKSAGAFGSVTVATNMAGRGTDILLEPGLDRRIVHQYMVLVKKLLSRGETQVALTCATSEEADILEAALGDCEGVSVSRGRHDGRPEVVVTSLAHPVKDNPESKLPAVRLEFGLGLYVIGTEMNESSRVDLQLRGRGGRQGEFGSSRFIMSLEDRPLVFRADTGAAMWRGMKRDPSGRAYFEGAGAHRLIDEVQSNAETEDELSRGATWDYNQVLERQVLSFYRARMDAIESDSFHTTCRGLISKQGRRIVDRYLPTAMIHHYNSQFNKISDELWLDYRVDCRPLWGLGVDALKKELAHLMTDRLEQVRARSDAPEFDRIERLLFVQTGDELWPSHLSCLQDLMLTTRLCAHGHREAVAEYVFRSIEAYRRFEEQVIDTFLPRLLAFTAPSTRQPAAQEVSVVEDVHKILV